MSLTSMAFSFTSTIKTLYHMIAAPFKINTKASLQDNLETFYKNQAEHYDSYRKRLLWGRTPMLQACLAYLPSLSSPSASSNLIWVDMGGGTGYNIEEMSKSIPINTFAKVYIVDLCESLCAQARLRVAKHEWTNVEVVHMDVCEFAKAFSTLKADLITFSYSLSMIPSFMDAITSAKSILRDGGIVASTDFYVAAKYDKPERRMPYWKRFFWQAFFDLDGVTLGPERRAFLEHSFNTMYEFNTSGSVPYMPLMKAPYYIWVGTNTNYSSRLRIPLNNIAIKTTKAPITFPPTFMYHQSWEDPVPDHEVLQIKPTDVCLTLTAGGCNTLHMLLCKPKQVVSVDINPAQTALMELKCTALRHLDYSDVWKLFGEGVHPEFEDMFAVKLAPYMSSTSRAFWEKKKHYFHNGLYSHGSMGKVSKILAFLISKFGLSQQYNDVMNSTSLEEQREKWAAFKNTLNVSANFNKGIAVFVEWIVDTLAFNKAVVWLAGGVPRKQYELIANDGVKMTQYFFRTLDGVFNNSYIKDNYFYFNILCGKYDTHTRPHYLDEKSYEAFHDSDLLDSLVISNDLFIHALRERKYDKVILMDHVDWLDEETAKNLAFTTFTQTNPGAKIIFRSAALRPFYVSFFEEAGFNVRCVTRIDNSGYMDRVNMYASFYVCTKP